MAAYDNVSLGNAPGAGSYAAPLLQFNALAELPAAYQQGNQDARTRALQGAFREGLPRDAQGNLDIGKMSETLAKLGGADAAMPLINLGIEQQMANRAQQDISGTLGQQPVGPNFPTTTTTVPAHGIPSANSGVTTQRQQDAGTVDPNTQPQTGPVARPVANPGQGDNGQNTLTSLVTQAYGADRAGEILPRYQAAFKIQDPNTPLDPQTMANVQGSLGRSKLAQGEGVGGVDATPTTGMTEATAAAFNARAAALRAAGAGMMKENPQRSAAYEAQAKAFDERAKQIREAIIKANEPTPEMKNARSVGQDVATFKRGELADKAEVDRYSKLYSGIQGAARSAAEMRPHLDLMNSFVNNPNFYSGPGEGINLYYKRVLANIPPSMGGDPNAAVPQEGMRKVLAANILNQVDQMKAMSSEMGSSSSRIFQSQIGLMTDAAQKPDNSPAAIRFLTELGIRAANHADAIADMASAHKGGRLDPQFEVALRKYEKDHPMFTHQELADTRLIAPPVAPATLRSTADVATWTQKAGLKRGDPFKLPDGSIGWAQ